MSSIDPRAEIVARIANQADAEVHVLKAPGQRIHDHGWTCTGCGQGADPAGTTSSLRADEARKAADRHAGHCRFLPTQS